MKLALFVSGVGDTKLALETIQSMEKKAGDQECFIISLTQAAQQVVHRFTSTLPLNKTTLNEILNLDSEVFLNDLSTPEELEKIVAYIKHHQIDKAYFGIPSINNAVPFQIAQALDDISVLMAYEFMFKPDSHFLWSYLPTLQNKSNVHWALPLENARDDFNIDDEKTHIVGHMSIDAAYFAKNLLPNTLEEIKSELQVVSGQSLAFVSSTTQPIDTDTTFLECLLEELPNHPNVQVRLGLHPGIQDLDHYLEQILSIYANHRNSEQQFKIILPDNLLSRLKAPDSLINNPLYRDVFLKANITGSQASSAADRVAQAVPGALLNEAALEGKPVFAPSGKPYLPRDYFSNTLSTFFSAVRHPSRTKEDLELDEKTAGERCATILCAF